MEPVRVKVYGLFPWTRRRYVVQSILDFASGVVVLIFWFFVWLPKMRPEVTRRELPTYMQVVVAILDQVPLILLIAVAIKVFEMWIVLRLFARKEVERLATQPPPSP